MEILYQSTWEDFQGNWVITDEYGCDTDESYMTEGISVSALCTQVYREGSPIQQLITDYMVNQSLNTRYCGYIKEYHNGYGDYSNITLIGNGFHLTNGQSYSTFPYYIYNSTYYPQSSGVLSINIPIFKTQAYAEEYMSNITTDERRRELIKDYTWNYKSGEVSPDGDTFTLTVGWTTGTWTSDQQPAVTRVDVQGLRGKIVSGAIALYKIDGIDDNKLKYGIKSTATFYDLEYTTDGMNWTATDSIPFDFIYRRRVNELGTFAYAVYDTTNRVPFWDNEEDADDFINGDKPITDATNWDAISPYYPPQPTTGVPDDEPTEMGEVYTRAFFSQQYICSASAMSEISNALFDVTQGGISGLWEDIKKGLEMYGDSPVDDIQGCMFFPVNLNEVFTNTQSQNYIYFGGYRFDMENSVNKILYPNGYKDFGSFKLNPLYSDGKLNHWRDYAPYTRLFCYLPYIGWVELDIARYIGKTVNVRYYFDTRTGGCLACLFAGGTLFDYFNGQCGVAMPITATDYVAYLNSQMQVLLGGSSDAKGNMGSVFNAGMNMAENGAMTAGAGLALGSVGLLGVGVSATKTLYGLTQNNINNFNKTKGASSSMLNQYLPQEVMFLLETQDADITPNEQSLMGLPSNASGTLQTFSGYLEVDTVNLVCADATDNEKAEIIRQLQQGVYI